MGKLYTYDGADWVEVVGATGASGTNGSDGKTILNGAIDPTTEGVDGDFYINTVANTIFGPKTAGAWGTGTSIIGADGADGADGLTVSVNSVTQVAGDISLTQDNIPDGTTNKAYTATEQSKLSGIEALADVTDATNVAAAGAVMDGDFSANGAMTRTAAGTYTSRTITGTTNQITVTNGDGVSGNPTLSLPQNIHTGASPTFAGGTLNGTLALTNSSVNSGDGNIDMPTSKGLQIRNATATATFRLLPSGNDIYFQNTVTAGAMVFTALNAADLTNDIMFKTTGKVRAYTDSVADLGSSSVYWRNTYTDRLYLNSTAYADGATAGQFKITGLLMPVQATTAGAPAYVKGAMYFDTTLNKLRVGGATAWETVTSA